MVISDLVMVFFRGNCAFHCDVAAVISVLCSFCDLNALMHVSSVHSTMHECLHLSVSRFFDFYMLVDGEVYYGNDVRFKYCQLYITDLHGNFPAVFPWLAAGNPALEGINTEIMMVEGNPQ